MNLVLIETMGNQAYIFSSNKLKENVGASQLTYKVGTTFVFDAIFQETQIDLRHNNKLSDPTINKPISNSHHIEVIFAVSGKALLLVENETLGKKIIANITTRVLKEAPGLEVRGVVSPPFDFNNDSIHKFIGELHKELEFLRSRLPNPSARFQRLPIVANCATSDLPASFVNRKKVETSSVSDKKQQNCGEGLERIRLITENDSKLPSTVDELEDLGCDWLGIVHADGNGLGNIFLNFDKHFIKNGTSFNAALDNRLYIDQIRLFSLALDECTECAFKDSLATIKSKNRGIPIVALVLGGDDLTVICDGRQALKFTKKFIDSFLAHTKKHKHITKFSIAKNGITTSAGVAIVKNHFPFYAGYTLAEELLRSAKKEKPESAIDFHILYDSSGPDLERIRAELTLNDGNPKKTLLIARPYFVSDNCTSEPSKNTNGRKWSDLEKHIQAVNKEIDGRKELPNSMLHELREGLFQGKEAAEAKLRLVLNRYPLFSELLDDKTSLFWDSGEEFRTALLDAVDVSEFWEGIA
jgi:hypothetical protein